MYYNKKKLVHQILKNDVLMQQKESGRYGF